jgi:Mrp family chromosome partitioning ATPase
MDVRNYPIGKGGIKSRYIKDVLVENGVAKSFRTRYTLAQLNAGQTLLPALPGVIWRMLSAAFIAVGGNATAATSVNIAATQAAAAAQLWIVTIAALTRSTQVFTGVTPAAGAQTLLADGASFAPCDVNTAVTLANVGSAMTTLTNIDVFLDYVADYAG